MLNRVSSASNLFDFFQALIIQSKENLSVKVSSDTSLYLASLLVEKTRSQPEDGLTLAELHSRAAKSSPLEQAKTYRELGDRALYSVGYFGESLQRRLVGPSYYEDMGAAAYDRVDRVFKQWFSNAFGEVFRELAEHFRECAQILAETRKSSENAPDPLEQLLKTWMTTRSEEAASRLREFGLVIPKQQTES